MSEVKRYHVTEAGLVEGSSLGRISVVLVADFDRINAEREALQQRLNVADQRNDDIDSQGSGNKAPRRSAALCDCNQGRLPCTCKQTAYDGFDNGSD